MPILRRNGERRLPAVLDSPSVLPFFFPIWGHDSTATIEHPGTAAPITDGAVIGGEDAAGFSGEFRLPGANVHKGQNRILVHPCGRDQNTGIVPATVGNAAVILGLDAAGVIGQLMMNGAFLDLTDVMDSNEFTAENFYMPLLDAGKLKGKQYILPLCFSVPTLTSAESVLKDSGFDMQAASKSLAATMDELLRIYKEKPMLVVTDFSMTSALSQPIIDYKNHTINLDTVSCRQTLAYEKEFRKGGISYEMQNGLFDSFNPEVVQDYFANGEPFASLDPSYMTVGLLRQCAALGIKTVTLPIPNELGGVTAEIGSYAMGNRNTKHPVEVKALLAYLLSEECQSSSAFADKDMNYARLEAASILVVIFVEAFVLSGMCLARKKRNN